MNLCGVLTGVQCWLKDGDAVVLEHVKELQSVSTDASASLRRSAYRMVQSSTGDLLTVVFPALSRPKKSSF